MLKNVNIVISAGQRLSVVGLNGAGKTTFIKLLCRLYDVNEGEILLNGINIREYSEDAYMQELAVVFQDYKLFALSIRENIELGDSRKQSEKDIARVCGLSGLTELVNSLQKGVDTPIVILDEPTAALDPVAEYEIYSHFNELVGGRTAIYISHRLSSCKFSNKIAVFSDRTIKEYGTHEELVKKQDGIYAAMFKAQAQYYA